MSWIQQYADYISSMFKPVGEVHSRTTRQTCNNDLHLPPRAKLNVYRNTLRYSGALIWNDLPANVKHVPSVQMFKVVVAYWKVKTPCHAHGECIN